MKMKNQIEKEHKVAIVTDSMISPGGADRLMQSVLKLFPNAEIFTTVYFPENYTDRFKIACQEVHTSFLQSIPFIRVFHRHLNVLSPVAFESFDMNGFDMIISLSAGASKGIIPQPEQRHIGIILTPPRSLWDGESNTRGLRLKWLYKLFTPYVAQYLRIWDQTAIKRVDNIVSISGYIQQKVRKTYRRESTVIYPGLDDYWFEKIADEYRPSFLKELPERYFLVVSRLYDYKKIDWAIEAAQAAGVKLVVVGTGPDFEYLKTVSKDETMFLGWVGDKDVKYLYRNADALIFCGIEDYGYVPVEAMASGCPVFAFNEGGVIETVEEGVSGMLFDDIGSLTKLLVDFSETDWNELEITNRAYLFDERKFHKQLTQFIEANNEI